MAMHMAMHHAFALGHRKNARAKEAATSAIGVNHKKCTCRLLPRDLPGPAGPLKMGYCPRVTSLGAMAGCAAFASLQALDMCYCPGVTSLAPLAGCTALQTLDIGDCPGVTDLVPLAGCTALQTLDMRGCPGVTDLGPLAGCAKLQALNMFCCEGVTSLGTLAGRADLRIRGLQGGLRRGLKSPDLKSPASDHRLSDGRTFLHGRATLPTRPHRPRSA